MIIILYPTRVLPVKPEMIVFSHLNLKFEDIKVVVFQSNHLEVVDKFLDFDT